MADKEIVIDVVSKYTDHASQGLNQTGKDAEKVGKELDDLGKKKPKIHVDADDKAKPKLDRTRKESERLGKERPKIQVGADDKATITAWSTNAPICIFCIHSFFFYYKFSSIGTCKFSMNQRICNHFSRYDIPQILSFYSFYKEFIR